MDWNDEAYFRFKDFFVNVFKRLAPANDATQEEKDAYVNALDDVADCFE